MRDPFQSPRRKIVRANEHINNLDVGYKRFFQDSPYARAIEPDPESGRQLHKMKLSKPLPPELTDLAAEAVAALRSALDQTGFTVSRAPRKSTYFPIADSAAELETDVIGRGRCKDIPPEILALFRSFKPYQGGNDLIWALNKLCNRDKHRSLVEVSVVTAGLKGSGLAMRGIAIPTSRWDGEKNEIVFLITEPGVNPDYNFKIALSIGFGDVEGVAGKHPVGVLRAMASEVERIVMATEAESRRLGLIA